MAVMTKKCYYSNPSKFILFYFYSRQLGTNKWTGSESKGSRKWARSDFEEIVKILTKSSPDPNKVYPQEPKVQKRRKWKIEIPASIEMEYGKTDTPLHYAAEKNHIEIFKLLLSYATKKQFQNTDNNDQVPLLHFAAKLGHYEIVKILVEYLNEYFTDYIDHKNYFGETALHIAAKYGHIEVVETLLEYTTFNVTDGSGWTPLHYAAKGCKTGHTKVLNLLGKVSHKMSLITILSKNLSHF